MMMRIASILALVCLHVVSSLHIGFFSQIALDTSKINEPDVADFLARIIEKFDVVGFNGVSDPEAIDVLLEVLTARNQNYRASFSPLISSHEFDTIPILKESLGFIYRNHVVSIGPLLSDRPTGAVSAAFNTLATGQKFVFSIVHLLPGDVEGQLDLLPDFYVRLTDDFDIENVIFSGDFNTVPGFINVVDFDAARVSQDPNFKWFVDYEDVTIERPSFTGAANRFLVAGPVKDWVVLKNVINTKEYYGLTTDQLEAITPFYPIEIDLDEKGFFFDD